MKYTHKSLAILIVFVLILSILPVETAQAIAPTTLTVNSTADPGPISCGITCTLRAAINDIAPGGTIYFDASLSNEKITLTAPLSITKSLTIDASGLSANVKISGNFLYRVFNIPTSSNTVTFKNLTITEAQITDISGGGIYIGSGNTVNIIDSHIYNNTVIAVTTSALGGGIYNLGTLNISNSLISSNTAGGTSTRTGGGIYSSGPATITNCLISSNSAAQGGGVLGNTAGIITVTNSTFYNNSAVNGGGGIYLTNGTLIVNGSTFDDNHATGGNQNGGGIQTTDETTITNSTFINNDVTGSGGAIGNFFGGTLTVVNSTFYNNEAYWHAGGIYNTSNDSTLTVLNSTFSGNIASNGYGGAIHNYANSTLHLKNSILANSTAAFGGDCHNQSGGTTSTFVNNLIKNNSANPDACGTPDTIVSSADPMLAPLADNDGPTQTMALLPSSPAIDKGNSLVCEDVTTVNNLDQRGKPRPIDGDLNSIATCDVGAFEFQRTPVTATLLSQGSYDGWVRERSETSNKGHKINKGSKVINVGDDAYNRQFRGILSFDTSSIPDNAVITSAELRVKYAGIVGTKGIFKQLRGLYYDIGTPWFGTTSTLRPHDFQKTASLANAGKFSSKKYSGWYREPLSSTARNYINISGITQFRLRFKKDDNNNFGADYLKLYSANAGATSAPQLVVEYYVP